MKKTSRKKLMVKRKALAVTIILTVFTSACVPFGPMGLVSRSALFLIEKDLNRAPSSGPISIKEMLAQANAGHEPGKSGDRLPLNITFSLPPESIELSTVQRVDLAEKLRTIGDAIPFSVVISSGPSGRSSDTGDAVIAIQRTRSAASHFSHTAANPRLRYDPALAPGELHIIIEPEQENDNA